MSKCVRAGCFHEMNLHDQRGCSMSGCTCVRFVTRRDAVPMAVEVQGFQSPDVVGRKDDGEKEDWSLLPLAAVREVVRVLDHGARKYARDNWMRVDNARDRYFAALMRHLVAWRGGERYDDESKLLHLAHAGCDVLFLIAFELQSIAEERVLRSARDESHAP